MDTGVSEKPLSMESEGDSPRVSSGEEEESLADPTEAAAVEAEPRHQDLAKGDTRRSKRTAAGLKRKTEDGPTPPQSKKKMKMKRQPPPSWGNFSPS